MENKSGKTGHKILLAILILVILIAGILLAFKIYQTQNNVENVNIQTNTPVQNQVEETLVVKEISIYKGNDRPIAVMIDNHKDAWPQARTK